MKKTTLIARVLAVAGIMLAVLWYFQQKGNRNSGLFYAAVALTGIAWVMTVISYAVTKNRKDLSELLIVSGLLLLGYLAVFIS